MSQNILQNNDGLWLVNAKSNDSLNTQFEKNDKVLVYPDLGFIDDEDVIVSSIFGEIKLKVKNSLNLRIDCVKITANTTGVNKLTPSCISNEGHGACYGEVKVSLSKLVL